MTLKVAKMRRAQPKTGPRTLLMLVVATATCALGGLIVPRAASGADDGLNACGCRQGSTPGVCYCEKKSRCGCPGECEPTGCEERRVKQMEKEIQAETRKAEDAARRQRPRDERESSRGDEDDGRGRNDSAREDQKRPSPPPAPRKLKIIKMTPAQKRDLAKLIGTYLVEHPEQGGKSIEQVRDEVSRR